MNITKSEEGYREVQTGDSKFIIEMDKLNSFWSVRPPAGFAPVPLRGVYTTVQKAMEAIKNYMDAAPTRTAIYRPKKPTKVGEEE